jgi:hypothetical protein
MQISVERDNEIFISQGRVDWQPLANPPNEFLIRRFLHGTFP